MTVLAAYFDESGDHGGSPCVAVGGYISTPDRWEVFESEWRAALAKYEIERFHMTDFANAAPPFDGWDRVKRDSCFDELVQITNDHALASVAIIVPLEPFNRIFSKKAKRACGGAYGLATVACFLKMAELVRERRPDGWINYIFDRRVKGSGQILKVFQYNMDRPEQVEELRLLSLTFECAERFVPLQAADILAHEMYRHLPRQLGIDLRLPRTGNLRKLARTEWGWGYFEDFELERWSSILELAPKLPEVGQKRGRRSRGRR